MKITMKLTFLTPLSLTNAVFRGAILRFPFFGPAGWDLCREEWVRVSEGFQPSMVFFLWGEWKEVQFVMRKRGGFRGKSGDGFDVISLESWGRGSLYDEADGRFKIVVWMKNRESKRINMLLFWKLETQTVISKE